MRTSRGQSFSTRRNESSDKVPTLPALICKYQQNIEYIQLNQNKCKVVLGIEFTYSKPENNTLNPFNLHSMEC